ncbi:MAG: hypothetical protein ACRC8W_21375 [Plesiomonas shigelloides]
MSNSQYGTNLMLPEGRIVSGHPMKAFGRVDRKTKQPVLDKAGKQYMDINFGVAIPKTQGVDWKATEWGSQIVTEAQDPVNGYPNGETNSPVFSWKVVDGDSNVPNRNGNKFCDKEGYPGHWVVFFSTIIPFPCYNKDHYQPHECIQTPDAVKKGDYVRMYVNVKGNKPSETPGVYINPIMLSLDRIGEPMASAAPVYNAAEVFGGAPASAAPAPVTPPAAPSVTPPPVAPAYDLVTPPEERYEYSGITKTLTEWAAVPGWTEELIKQHGKRV